MRLRHRVRTAASPADVWSLLGTPSRWPEFDPLVGRVRGVAGPAVTGQRLLASVRTVGLGLPLDVVEAVPGERLVVRVATVPGVVEETTWVLTPSVKGGTDIAVSVVVDGPLARPACLPAWAGRGLAARVLAARADRLARDARRAGAA